MTTIVIDFEGKRVYSDSCVSTDRYVEINGGDVSLGKCDERRGQKIFKRGDVIIAGVGNSKTLERFVAYEVDSVPTKSSDNTVIFKVYERSFGLFVCKFTVMRVRHWFYTKRYWKAEPVLGSPRYLCAGSGQNYAEGALAAGATPEEAITAASKCCPYTDTNIQSEGF